MSKRIIDGDRERMALILVTLPDAVMVVSCLVPGIMIFSRDVSRYWRNAILLLRVLVHPDQIVLPCKYMLLPTWSRTFSQLKVLWSTILQSAQGWTEAAAAISLSCAGNTVDQILVQYSTTVYDITDRWGFYLSSLVIQSVIFAIIWADGYLCRRGTRLIGPPSAEDAEAELLFTDIHS